MVLKSGTTTAVAAADRTVHVDVTGLEPATDYWYRFRALGVTSPTGRTRTVPTSGTTPIRLGVVTCAEYEFGFFGAYRHLANRDDLDAVLHLGDYIYEFGIGYGKPGAATPTPGPAIGRSHLPDHECVSLADYRMRHAQYRADVDAQAMHAAHPVIAIYDDHEIANDAWREGAANHDEGEGPYAARIAAALRAWWEWMPVRQTTPDPRLAYRSFRFGDVAELFVLDLRRYRDAQPMNLVLGYGSVDPANEDPNRTILGAAQRDWLTGGVSSSAATWKVLGTPVMFSRIVIAPPLAAALTTALGPVAPVGLPLPPALYVEDWNGYAADRRRVIDAVLAKPVGNVVFLTGDYHESFVAEVPPNIENYLLDGVSIAVEFVAPAVSSPGLGEVLERSGVPNATAVDMAFDANLTLNNPWFKYHEGRSHGFGVVEFAADRVQYDFWFLADRLDRASAVRAASSWEVRAGTATAVPASAPLPSRVRSSGVASPSPSAGPLEVIPVTGGTSSLAPAAGAAAAAALALRRASRDVR
jgi:alkaline phosphatase D